MHGSCEDQASEGYIDHCRADLHPLFRKLDNIYTYTMEAITPGFVYICLYIDIQLIFRLRLSLVGRQTPVHEEHLFNSRYRPLAR